ncbi:MAG: hypothetical protein JRG96_00720 [Deltaproteobacteria bacterium]|nr:hypothetical protein [Deltaproteobacteria bacterium]MBW2417198.1 hypothetical protein [Deltaproteobacteria bacterium]
MNRRTSAMTWKSAISVLGVALLAATPALASDGQAPAAQEAPAAREEPAAARKPAAAAQLPTAAPPTAAKTPLPDWSALNPLGGHYSARYRADDLPINGGAGTRVGRGEVAYSIPVAGPLYLRSGVLLDYVQGGAVQGGAVQGGALQPADDPAGSGERRELGGTPTLGFEVRF